MTTEGRRITAFAFVVLLAEVPPALYAQEPGSVVGTVVAEGSLQPLEGALVRVEGTPNHTVADEEGRFELADVRVGEITLRVESSGHVTLTEVIDMIPGEVALVHFRLTSIAVALEELVVQARQEPLPRDRGFADGTIEVPDDAASLSAADLVEQAVPGLSIARGSGLVGGGVSMRIRGASSLALTDAPAVYIDGVLVGGENPRSRGNVQALHVLQLIPAHSVRRIRVLRGPAATAAFPEAKNGVILVETWK